MNSLRGPSVHTFEPPNREDEEYIIEASTYCAQRRRAVCTKLSLGGHEINSQTTMTDFNYSYHQERLDVQPLGGIPKTINGVRTLDISYRFNMTVVGLDDAAKRHYGHIEGIGMAVKELAIRDVVKIIEENIGMSIEPHLSNWEFFDNGIDYSHQYFNGQHSFGILLRDVHYLLFKKINDMDRMMQRLGINIVKGTVDG